MSAAISLESRDPASGWVMRASSPRSLHICAAGLRALATWVEAGGTHREGSKMIESTHSSPERAEVRAVRESGRTSVLVIGAGINGISTFRDLALQGVDVLLVERGDFASGASAASSHMIHGGIRYLENGEFRLVRESVEERNGLLKIAPHYVKPLETTIPIYSTCLLYTSDAADE